jgi:AraC-like DNA-binding protein
MALSICDSKTDAQGRELIEHGTTFFPIACYHDDLQKLAVPWHWHDELEVAVITEGQAIIAAGSEKILLGPGKGFFINSGVLHAAWDVDSSNCRIHSIVFHARLVGGSIDSVFWHNYILPLLANPSLKFICFNPEVDWNQDAINAIEETWKNCVYEPSGYEFAVRNNLSQLIYLLNTHHSTFENYPSEKELRDGERIKKMLHYIHEHYSEELNTEKIAKSIIVSPSECLRCFHNTIGTTPIQYVKQYRVQKAVELLKTSNRTISDIGIQCGFQEMSYFAKTFREFHGVTPSEFRKL